MFDAIGLDVVVNQLISSLDGIRVVVLMIDHLVIYKRSDRLHREFRLGVISTVLKG